MSEVPYSEAFYAEQGDGSLSSASRIVPLLLELFRPHSVVDVGCGVGGWLAEFRQRGVTDTAGLDGPWINPSRLLIPVQDFRPLDLTKPIELGRDFDMCICLEVAEHMAEEHADQLIDSLVSLAPVVVFSAAIPNQSGVNHVNEQWQEYWAAQFEARGFVTLDCVRPVMWSDTGVQWWYAQNLLVYVHNEMVLGRPNLAAMAERSHRDMLNVVHPGMLAMITAGSGARLADTPWRLRALARMRRVGTALARRSRSRDP